MTEYDSDEQSDLGSDEESEQYGSEDASQQPKAGQKKRNRKLMKKQQ